MSLVGADLCMILVEGITLLVVGADDLLQYFHREIRSGFPDARDQVRYIRPTVRIQRDADDLRLVPQDQRYIFLYLCSQSLPVPVLSNPFCFPFRQSWEETLRIKIAVYLLPPIMKVVFIFCFQSFAHYGYV